MPPTRTITLALLLAFAGAPFAGYVSADSVPAAPSAALNPDGTLIATVTGTGTAATLRYIHTDHLGGTKAVTDANGRVEMLDYYPYGGTRVDESTGYNERRKYIGGEYDTGTGLYYLEARYQNPVTGRFVSEDPVFTAVGDVGALRERGISLNEVLADPQLQNSYSYGSNNPLKNVDANGEWIDTVVDVGFAAHSLYKLGVAIATGGDVKGEAINFGLDVGGMAIPGVVGLGTARRVATKASLAYDVTKQLPINKAIGNAYEAEQLAEFSKRFSEVGKQITIKTDGGIKTRLDILTRDSFGRIGCIECKSSLSAPLTKNQRLAFPKIKESGGMIVGKGKPGFEGGTRVGPTEVLIKRKGE